MFSRQDQFEHRHIGTTGVDLAPMLKALNVSSLDQLIQQTIPDAIRRKGKMNIPDA